MRASKRKPGGGMVEGRSRPTDRCVAEQTIRWKPGRGVIGVRSIGEIGLVTAKAGGIGAGQVVVIVGVALLALHRRVGASEGESRDRVVKRDAAGPPRSGVALLASRGVPQLDVAGIAGSLEILDVAGIAVGRGPGENAVNVAQIASDGGMAVREGEAG